MTTKLQAALELTSRGFRVFPLGDGGSPEAKKPRFNGWQLHATTDPVQVAVFWSNDPNANIGIACGGVQRLVILDVDPAKGGDASLSALPPGWITLESRTGSGGAHLYFHAPADLPMPRNRVEFRPGLDLRSQGGYVVAPPSVHESGGVYQWANTLPILEMPRWLYDIVTEGTAETRAVEERTPRTDPPLVTRLESARKAVADLPAAISGKGGHNTLLVAATVAYRGFDLPREVATIVLEEYNTRCVPPWSPSELAHKLDAVETNERTGEHWGYLLDIDDMSAALRPDEPAPTSAATSPRARIEWVHGVEAEAELPPPNWIVPKLQICPGRPTMIAGYGSSGKTLIAQSLLLACAAGKQVWGVFDTPRKLVVRHLDHDQGRYATHRRYQRLAQGMGVSLRELGTSFGFATSPDIHLTDKDAKARYVEACVGADLVLIDALRGAAAGVDENDSRIRECVDVLAWVSEKIGTAFILIHHAGKVAGEDKRTGPRGSSAIFDGCGCVLQIEAKEPHEPKSVHQTKGAAEAEGGSIPPFMLSIEHDDANALHVKYRAFEGPPTSDEKRDNMREAIVLYVENHKGCTRAQVADHLRDDIKMKFREESLTGAIQDLVTPSEGRPARLVNRSSKDRQFRLCTPNNDPGHWLE